MILLTVGQSAAAVRFKVNSQDALKPYSLTNFTVKSHIIIQNP